MAWKVKESHTKKNLKTTKISVIKPILWKYIDMAKMANFW